MDLMNPYNKPEVSQEFPWGLAVVFGLGIIGLAFSIYLLILRGSKDEEKKKQFPEWAYNLAYAGFFLLLPFIMLISTMLFFPCWWQNCPS